MSNDEPCLRVKANRMILFGFMAFIIGWCSWLSVNSINAQVAMARYDIQVDDMKSRIIEIQSDLSEMRSSAAKRDKVILDFIKKQEAR